MGPKKVFGRKLIVSVIILVIITCLGLSMVSCTSKMNFFKSSKVLTILSGSENQVLEPILSEFGKENNVDIQMTYKGSIDIMKELEKDEIEYDAVFPANSIWISMGDKKLRVKHQESITTTPVVFGIKKSVAEKLGFVGKDVTTKDILEKIKNKELTFMMTSATQSNSGATAYLGFIYALLDNPEVITQESLNDNQLKEDITTLLSGVNRSSGSSNWLKDLFLQSNYDAMVNYESVIIDTNKELVAQNKEPLYVIYPKDGLGIADSPLGYIDNGDKKKEEVFLKLQEFLTSEKVKPKLLELGRRTTYAINFKNENKDVFNPDWGIDTEKVLNVMKMPSGDVIEEALGLYQTELRKPSLTVYCLDYSGSMEGEGVTKLCEAMNILLDQQKAKEYMLQASEKDVTIVIPFSSGILGTFKVEGNDENKLLDLYNLLNTSTPMGGTNIYLPLTTALEELKQYDIQNYTTSIILMTDGQSNEGSFESVQQKWTEEKSDIPIFSITFGDSDETQLQELANFSKARVFDGKKDLESAFKQAKGYN